MAVTHHIRGDVEAQWEWRLHTCFREYILVEETKTITNRIRPTQPTKSMKPKKNASVTNQIPRMAPATAMGIETLQFMKTKLTMLKFLIVLCSTFATTAVFGQTLTWIGPDATTPGGGNLGRGTNWSGDNGSGATTPINGTIGTFDGTLAGPLVVFSQDGINGAAGVPIGGGYGSSGFTIDLTPSQTSSVKVISPVPAAAGMGFNAFRVQSGAGQLILGDNTANQIVNILRPSAGTHTWYNYSTNPVVINPNFQIQNGGGAAGHIINFLGTGDFAITNNLRFNNNAPSGTLQWDSTGTTIWAAGGNGLGTDNNRFNSAQGPVIINAGTVIIKSSDLFPNTPGANTIAHAGTLLKLDAPAQSDTMVRAISGAGPLQVNDGSWTFTSGASTFTGNILLTGGTLIAGGTETVGTSGPLGFGGTISFNGGTLGWNVNNVFDYSSRFSTAASQAYSFDTGGQNVTLATGLSSSGGTLTKANNGTLTLSGTSSYSGLTTVSGGKLVLQGSKTGSGNITVADGAALGVTDTGTQVTPGTLTVGTSGDATLEFNNVNSTTTAPLAAGTLSSASTVTINVNNGTFTVGQSYPLFSWTSGSAPAVNLGILNGFVGNLTTNGNSIKLNVTATSFTWTGIADGNWDLTTANNWLQNGGAVIFANGGPAFFDDSSTRTNVTVNALVQPTTITVSSTNPYSITSSGGNNIGGSAKLTKTGNGSLALSGGANTYTGVTTLSGGTMSVGALANGGVASDIGQAGSSAANLVLNGGTLQYTGSGASIDRLFTLSTGNGTIDNLGSALVFSNAAPLAYTGNGARTLTLAGTNEDNNTLAAALANNGGATALTKNGTGKWILTGTNSHSGVTTIANGILQIGAGGATGSPGSGNITDNGLLVFNRAGTLTVSGAISGTGAVINDGTGTVILANNSTYPGGTTINAGTLQVGNGGATGSLNSGGPITNNSLLIFNSTAASSYSGNGLITGPGNVIVRGNGSLVKAIGANDYTGWTLIEAGATFQPCEGQNGGLASSVVTNNGTLKLVRQDTATFFVTNNIVGTGRLLKDVNNQNDNDVTLLGVNTYTGGTVIAGGEIVLGDGVTPGLGSIVGDVIFTNSPTGQDLYRSLTFNHLEDVTYSGILSGTGGVSVANSGRVVQRGSGTLTLTGNNTHRGGAAINAGTLQVGNGGTSGSIGSGPITDNGVFAFNRSDNVTLSNVISDGTIAVGSLVKLGAGTLTLAVTNGYTGTTTVSNGTLVVNSTNTAASTIVYGGTLGGSGTFIGAAPVTVTLNPGTTLAPGASVGTMTINGDLSIGGNVAIEVNKSLAQSNDLVVVTGALNNTGTGTLTVANLGPALVVGDKFTLFSQLVANGAALTVTGGNATWANNLAVDGSISVATVLVVTPPTLTFTPIGGNSLQFSWTGSFKLQSQTNSINVGISNNWVDYPGGGTSPVTAPIDVTKGTVFFRLAPAP
jgi:fibronectin-binding autotransporter adhesin